MTDNTDNIDTSHIELPFGIGMMSDSSDSYDHIWLSDTDNWFGWLIQVREASEDGVTTEILADWVNKTTEVMRYDCEAQETDIDWLETEDEIIRVADDVWATDNAVIGGIWHLANHAQKPISLWDGNYDMVDDNATRLAALIHLSKVRDHLEKKNKKKKSNTKIKYVLIRD